MRKRFMNIELSIIENIQKNLGWVSPKDYTMRYTSFIESKNVST